MKVRFGFVSNSSSTSFCLYGADIDISTAINFLKSKGIEIPDNPTVSDIITLLKEYFKDTEFLVEMDAQFSSDYYGFFIGYDPFKIGLDETGKQFKESVDNVLKSINPNIKCINIIKQYNN